MKTSSFMRYSLKIFLISVTLTFFSTDSFAAVPPPQTAAGAVIEENIVNGKNSYKIDIQSDKPHQKTALSEPIIFTVSFSNNAATSRSFDVSAEWSAASMDANPGSTFDIVAYVPGSASQPVNQNTAIIDPENRRVTWHFENVPPGGKKQQVSFQLIARDPLLAENTRYTYRVFANLLHSGGTVSGNELEILTIGETPPTTAPPPQSGKLPKMLFAAPTEITDTSASFYFSYLSPTATNIRFESFGGHNGTLNDQRYLARKSTTIKGLRPDTVYYARFESTDIDRNILNEPERWIFRTAKQGMRDYCQTATVFISADDILISPKELNAGERLTIPRGTKIEFSIIHPEESPFSSSARFGPIASGNILSWADSTEIINFNRGAQNTYSGSYILPKIDGDYGLFFDCREKDGGIARRPIAIFQISESLKITDFSGRPVVKAQIELKYFEKSKKLFEKYPALINGRFQITPKDNGLLDIFLIKGRYRARVSAPGFHPKNIEFSFDPAIDKKYPVFVLEKNKTSLPYFALSISENFKEIAQAIKNDFDQITIVENFRAQSTIVAAMLAILLGILGNLDYFVKFRFFQYINNFMPQKEGVIKLLAVPALLFIAKNIFTLTVFFLFIFYFWLIAFMGPLKIRAITGLTVINAALILKIIWQKWCVYYDETKNHEK